MKSADEVEDWLKSAESVENSPITGISKIRDSDGECLRVTVDHSKGDGLSATSRGLPDGWTIIDVRIDDKYTYISMRAEKRVFADKDIWEQIKVLERYTDVFVDQLES